MSNIFSIIELYYINIYFLVLLDSAFIIFNFSFLQVNFFKFLLRNAPRRVVIFNTVIKNQVSQFKRIIGLKYNNDFAKHELSKVFYKHSELSNGDIGIHVTIYLL
jgi:hypothetical protein